MKTSKCGFGLRFAIGCVLLCVAWAIDGPDAHSRHMSNSARIDSANATAVIETAKPTPFWSIQVKARGWWRWWTVATNAQQATPDYKNPLRPNQRRRRHFEDHHLQTIEEDNEQEEEEGKMEVISPDPEIAPQLISPFFFGRKKLYESIFLQKYGTTNQNDFKAKFVWQDDSGTLRYGGKSFEDPQAKSWESIQSNGDCQAVIQHYTFIFYRALFENGELLSHEEELDTEQLPIARLARSIFVLWVMEKAKFIKNQVEAHKVNTMDQVIRNCADYISPPDPLSPIPLA